MMSAYLSGFSTMASVTLEDLARVAHGEHDRKLRREHGAQVELHRVLVHSDVVLKDSDNC
jgi:hypothetical protein